VGPNPVIGLPPAFHEHLHLPECIKQFPIQQFIPEFPIKTLNIPVLPRTTWGDEERLYTDPAEPRSDRGGRKFWPIIRPNMLWHSPLDKELVQPIEHVVGSQPSFDVDDQTFLRVFVRNGEELHRSPIFGPCRHEVVRPHMIRMLCSQPDTRTIGQPEPPTRRLFLGHLQPFVPPDAFHPLVINPPALIPQQPSDLSIPVAAILTGQLDDGGRQWSLIIG